MRLSNGQDLKKITRINFQNLVSLLDKNRYFIVISFKILKMEFKLYNNKGVNHSSQFISVKVKKKLRKSPAQFREKLRKLRLRQNDGILIKKTCS